LTKSHMDFGWTQCQGIMD